MRLLRTTGTFLFAVAAAFAATGCTFLTGVHPVSRVSVSVAPSVIGINQTAGASGAAFDGSNALQGTRYNITFTSRNPAIATVNAVSGLIIGVAYGTTYIVGENNGKRDSAMIAVRPTQARSLLIGNRNPLFRVGATNAIFATGLDSLNRQITDRAVVWTARTPTVLTISGAGVVTPLTAGSSWIVASLGNGPGASPALDSVQATVTPTPVVSIRVTPNNDNNNVPTVYLGQTLQFTAVITDSLLNTVTRPIVWSTGDRGTVLNINSASGVATPVAAFNTTVTATVDVVPGYTALLGTRTSTVSVAVLAPTDTVRVRNSSGTSITTITVATGSTTALTLVPYDAVGNTLFNRTFRVTSSNPAVATVPPTSSGVTQLTAVAAGTTTLTVQALDANGATQGKVTSVTVTVTP